MVNIINIKLNNTSENPNIQAVVLVKVSLKPI